jgi:DNA-binding MarR family transcriptional regulator
MPMKPASPLETLLTAYGGQDEMTTKTQAAPKIDGEQAAAWRAFLRAHALMLRRIGEDLDEAGLPPFAWYDVLLVLHEAPEHHLQPSELADEVVLSRSGLSRMIDRIEEAGLVERRACPGDRRAINVALTEQGEKMLDEMWCVYARGISDHFLPALGEEACTVRQAMESVAESVRRPSADEVAGSDDSPGG